MSTRAAARRRGIGPCGAGRRQPGLVGSGRGPGGERPAPAPNSNPKRRPEHRQSGARPGPVREGTSTAETLAWHSGAPAGPAPAPAPHSPARRSRRGLQTRNQSFLPHGNDSESSRTIARRPSPSEVRQTRLGSRVGDVGADRNGPGACRLWHSSKPPGG